MNTKFYSSNQTYSRTWRGLWGWHDCEELIGAPCQRSQITAIKNLIRHKLAIYSGNAVYGGFFPTAFTGPRLDKFRSRGCGLVSAKACFNISSKAQLYAIGRKFRDNLNSVEKASCVVYRRYCRARLMRNAISLHLTQLLDGFGVFWAKCKRQLTARFWSSDLDGFKAMFLNVPSGLRTIKAQFIGKLLNCNVF